MNIDDVARRMTDNHGGRRGPAGPAFTARVMAPIHGRPRPGFTARVMNRIDEPGAVGRTFRSGFGRSFSSGALRALILVPAAIALAAGVSVLRASRVVAPALPDAPRRATAEVEGPRADATSLQTSLETPVRAPRRTQRRAGQATAVVPDAPPIYTIPALDGPSGLTLKPMLAPPVAIPALAGPAPLKITELPGAAGGSPSDISKEKS